MQLCFLRRHRFSELSPCKTKTINILRKRKKRTKKVYSISITSTPNPNSPFFLISKPKSFPFFRLHNSQPTCRTGSLPQYPFSLFLIYFKSWFASSYIWDFTVGFRSNIWNFGTRLSRTENIISAPLFRAKTSERCMK